MTNGQRFYEIFQRHQSDGLSGRKAFEGAEAEWSRLYPDFRVPYRDYNTMRSAQWNQRRRAWKARTRVRT